jgi:GDPmannose 4,6-dehydratase
MWKMLQYDTPEDFVVATGETHSVREFCELAFAQVGLPLEWRGQDENEVGIGPDGRTLVAIDPQYFRPSEVEFLLGDASKAKRLLGWEPKVTFAQLVHMMVEHDLAAVSRR